MAIGADADGNYSLLYAGDDFVAAQEQLEKPPKDLHQIFIFRSGQLVRTRETAVARAIRQAHLDKALEDAEAAIKKAAADREKKEKEAAEKKTRASAELTAKLKKEAADREAERNKRNADILQRAASKAAEKVPQKPARAGTTN